MNADYNLIGERFGRLVVTSFEGRNSRHQALSGVRCDCGTQKVVPEHKLKSGAAISCGCIRRDKFIVPADWVGRKVGRLLVESECGRDRFRAHLVQVRCDCGEQKVVRLISLKKGEIRSCGCLSKELAASRMTKHGKTETAEFRTWSRILSRCYNPNNIGWDRYGGRGIAVCDRWRFGEEERSGFECFLADMGMRPPGRMSIERLDNDGPYSPSNCVWATSREQTRNYSRNLLVPWGVGLVPLVVVTEVLELPYARVRNRLRLGWSLERAVTE